MKITISILTAVFLAANAVAAPAAVPPKPNIILIMCDDAGFADFGPFGGLADTPVLDKLAAEGMRFTRAYSNARCMPTRASLLTGLNPQQCGENRLNGYCVTIPEVLKDAGYASYMVGKWHLGYGPGHGPSRETRDPVTQQLSTPAGRGFDRFYGIWAGASQPTKEKLMAAKDGGAVRIIQDDRVLDWSEVPDDYYNTRTWTDKAIEFMKSTPQEKPFFLYVAHTAPHWPIGPPPESVARYKGRFDEGWDVLRQRIADRQKKLGLFPADYPVSPRSHLLPDYAAADNQTKTRFQSGTEQYYATITEMDEQIGRLIATLREMGREKNTLVVFFSDNGPDQLIGGPGRAELSRMPFSGYKLTYLEGGAATPLIVWWPGVVPANTINHRHQLMLEDHLATYIELAGAKYPAERLGQKITPLEGRSYLKAIMDPQYADPDRVWCWEHDGQRGVVANGYKAIFADRRHPAVKGSLPESMDGWSLYKHDPHRIETENLAAAQPERMKEMIEIWKAWAKRVEWVPSSRWNLHPGDAAHGIRVYGTTKRGGAAGRQ